MGTLIASLVALFGGLIGALFISKNKNDSLTQKLAAGKYENEDATLVAKQADLATNIAAEQKVVDVSKPPESAPALTPEQVTDYWNKK